MSFSERQRVVKLLYNLRFPERHSYDDVFERRNPSFVGSMMKLILPLYFVDYALETTVLTLNRAP